MRDFLWSFVEGWREFIADWKSNPWGWVYGELMVLHFVIGFLWGLTS